MIRSIIPTIFFFHFIILASHASSSEKQDISPLRTSLKALRTVNGVKDIQKRFKVKIENKVKNVVGNVLSDVMTKRLSGAAFMLITKEVKVKYKDFRLTFDKNELSLTYGKGF